MLAGAEDCLAPVEALLEVAAVPDDSVCLSAVGLGPPLKPLTAYHAWQCQSIVCTETCASAGAQEYLAPVEALLEVAAFPDNSICQMTYNFWGRLASELTTGFSPAGGQVGALLPRARGSSCG